LLAKADAAKTVADLQAISHKARRFRRLQKQF